MLPSSALVESIMLGCCMFGEYHCENVKFFDTSLFQKHFSPKRRKKKKKNIA